MIGNQMDFILVFVHSAWKLSKELSRSARRKYSNDTTRAFNESSHVIQMLDSKAQNGVCCRVAGYIFS